MQSTTLDIIEVKDGVILPARYVSMVFPCGVGGVVNANGEFIVESGADFPVRFGGVYEYSILEEDVLEEVIYLGYLRTHWGHFLADCTLRMWYLYGKDIHCKIAYCGALHEKNMLPENIFTFFNILGIKREQLLDIRQPTRARRILIPQASMNFNHLYTYEFNSMFRGISKVINTDLYETSEKLYYTRTRLENEKEIGEELIEEIFKKNGYKIISPERESLEKQIALMKSCKIFVSMEGTIAHNIVFAEQHTRQIILKKHTYMNIRQPYLNECMGIEAIYINIGCRPFGKNFPRDFYDGIFWVRATRELKDYCSKNNMWFPPYGKVFIADVKNVAKYLYQCGKYIKKYLIMQQKIHKEDKVILKKVHQYKNIVIYGVNERALRWERKIKVRYSCEVFLTDTNWRAIQKYRNIYNWEILTILEKCCFIISIKDVRASAEVKKKIMEHGINEKDICCYAST